MMSRQLTALESNVRVTIWVLITRTRNIAALTERVRDVTAGSRSYIPTEKYMVAKPAEFPKIFF